MECTIEQLAQWTKGEIVNYTNDMITNVVIDTRLVTEGSLFIPFKGEKVDGHHFVNQAFEQGAVLALWEAGTPNMPIDTPLIIVEDSLTSLQNIAKHYLATLQTKIIAITGSNGKTTTKDMIAQVLSSQYQVQKTQGNYNNEIGVPLTILSLLPTTQYAIIEMGMDDFGQIAELSQLVQPDVAVITNIGESHLQQLGSREGIAKAKSEIIESLRDTGLFIYNGDEPLLNQLHQSQQYQFKAVRYGLSDNNDIYASYIKQEGLITTFVVQDVQYELPVVGEHNIYNALAAISIAQYLGISSLYIVESLKKLELTPMRMETIVGPNDSLLINDAYNASPTSMKAAIDTLEMMAYECKILVIGDMLELGKDEIMLHQQIGHYLNNKNINIIITYGQLSKHIDDVLKLSHIQHHHFMDKLLIIQYLKQFLNSNTVILFKGSRGMRLEEILEALQSI